MIKYNNNTINDWNFGASNIKKVYRNGAVVYYKIVGSSPTPVQEPCFAVVDDITQYQETEFEDVFDKATEKWYKLNNLNAYEKYGVYGSGKNITYYEGKLTVDEGYEYEWNGSSWVNVGEVTGSTATLPDVSFVLNYNAKNYDAATHSIPMTSGQLNDTDAVAYNSPNNIVDHHEDGYITISNSSMRIRKSGQDISLFNRESNSTSSDLTIVCKAKSTSGENIITNRDSNYNWMYRLKTSGILTLHGQSETGSIAWNTSNPDIMSVRTYYDSDTKLKYNNWTQNTSTSPTSFEYGDSNGDSGSAGALFVGFGWNETDEQWSGDFYWVYMTQNTLTDEQVQQVIAYNEGGGGQTEYPKYYDEVQDPPDNVSFSSMAEAEAYECPWWGMTGIIDNTDYLFCESNEWLTKYAYQEVSGEYICDSGDKYKKMQEYDRQADGTFSPSSNYVNGDLIESGSPDCVIACSYNFCGVDANGNDVVINNGTTTLTSYNWESPYPVEGIVGDATTIIGEYCFQNIKNTITALTIGNSVTTIEHEAFMETENLTTLTIPSSVTQIDFWAFTRCYGMEEVIFEGTTPPNFTNSHSGVFHDYCPTVIYVPDSAVSEYRAIDGSVWTNQSWSSDIIQPISNR